MIKDRIKEGLKLIMPIVLIAAFILIAIKQGPNKSKSEQAAILGDGINAEVSADQEYPMSRDAFLLDTFCSITIYEGGGSEALSDAVVELGRYDDLLNPSKEQSDIYRINHRTDNKVEISKETKKMLEKIVSIDSTAGGDLNTAIKPLTELWDFKEKKEVPPKELIEKAGDKVSLGEWKVSEENGVFYFESDNENVRIDAGSYAKGFIADEIKLYLKNKSVKSAVINLGGNIQCLGKKPDGGDFVIGLREPKKGSERYLKKLDINDESVVTAGIYERYFEKDGVHYHHIIDPHTGYPVQNELAAVTVVGPDSMYCDALSTALFIKGREAGTEYLRMFNESCGEGLYKAFFIDKDTHISYTEGAKQLVHN